MNGTRTPVSRRKAPAEERFWAKVQKTDACWLWTDALTAAGYGRFRPGGSDGKVSAHRYSFELLVHAIPAGLEIDHLCRNRACINPAHLEVVTAQLNIQRRDQANQFGRYKVQFSCGHEADEQNTYIHQSSGRRSCRACARLRAAKNRKQAS